MYFLSQIHVFVQFFIFIDLKEWSYDTDQASYQKLFGFHFPPTQYHGSCERNPFICLKTAKPYLSACTLLREKVIAGQ